MRCQQGWQRALAKKMPSTECYFYKKEDNKKLFLLGSWRSLALGLSRLLRR